jgi:hypothetical protein
MSCWLWQSYVEEQLRYVLLVIVYQNVQVTSHQSRMPVIGVIQDQVVIEDPTLNEEGWVSSFPATAGVK